MNQIFAGSAAVAVIMVLFSLGRRPNKQILQGGDENPLQGLNISQIALVKPLKDQKPSKVSSDLVKFEWHAPKTARERIDLEVHIRELMKSAPQDRLKAIEISARRWTYN